MSKLRDEAIESMVNVLVDWEEQIDWHQCANEVLDALLDFLEAHTEELAEGVVIAWGGTERANEAHWYDARLAAPVLVAALRGTTKEQ